MELKFREPNSDCVLEVDREICMIRTSDDSMVEWVDGKPIGQKKSWGVPTRIGDKLHERKYDFLIEATVSIYPDARDRTMPDWVEIEPECHKIYFTREDWDDLVKKVKRGQLIVFKNCRIAYRKVDNDFFDLYEGSVVSADAIQFLIEGTPSVLISPPLSLRGAIQFLTDEDTPSAESDDEDEYCYLPGSAALRESMLSMEAREERYDLERSGGYEDPLPTLADCYDDLEELELNTRGDGFD